MLLGQFVAGGFWAVVNGFTGMTGQSDSHVLNAYGNIGNRAVGFDLISIRNPSTRTSRLNGGEDRAYALTAQEKKRLMLA